MDDYSALTDKELVARVKARDGRAVVEMGKRCAERAGAIIQRVVDGFFRRYATAAGKGGASDLEWLTPLMLEDAVDDVLRIMRNTIEHTDDPDTLRLHELMEETAQDIGVLLYRRYGPES